MELSLEESVGRMIDVAGKFPLSVEQGHPVHGIRVFDTTYLGSADLFSDNPTESSTLCALAIQRNELILNGFGDVESSYFPQGCLDEMLKGPTNLKRIAKKNKSLANKRVKFAHSITGNENFKLNGFYRMLSKSEAQDLLRVASSKRNLVEKLRKGRLLEQYLGVNGNIGEYNHVLEHIRAIASRAGIYKPSEEDESGNTIDPVDLHTFSKSVLASYTSPVALFTADPRFLILSHDFYRPRWLNELAKKAIGLPENSIDIVFRKRDEYKFYPAGNDLRSLIPIVFD